MFTEATLVAGEHHMPLENTIDDYLAKAREAEEQARKAAQTSARESWLRVAGAYRQMAEHRLGGALPAN